VLVPGGTISLAFRALVADTTRARHISQPLFSISIAPLGIVARDSDCERLVRRSSNFPMVNVNESLARQLPFDEGLENDANITRDFLLAPH
jgi:hypothetical protein